MRSRSPAIDLPDLLSSYDFDLPEDRIAVEPSANREEARLLVLDRSSNGRKFSTVDELGTFLNPGDLLVLNRARVDPARVEWTKPQGGQAELILLSCIQEDEESSDWEAIVSGRNLKAGVSYTLPGGTNFHLMKRGTQGVATIRLPRSKKEVRAWLGQVGLPPVPPYIRGARKRKGLPEKQEADRERYQTVFASESGAVAAPTAGLHFTEKLFEELRVKGIRTEFLHLSVGWGTFSPLTAQHFVEGRLHREWVSVTGELVSAICETKARGGRVVAVGTTVVRALEWWSKEGANSLGASGWCDLFIHPPQRPGVADALLTNFHLPQSSLLFLVSAFLGDSDGGRIVSVYEEAIREGFRFFSYGDAMLIL